MILINKIYLFMVLMSLCTLVGAESVDANGQARKAIADYAQSKGLTEEQLDRRIGMNHDDLVAWAAGFFTPSGIDYLQRNGGDIFEQLGYISNIETLNSANDAITPQIASEQDRDPEFEITSIELVNSYRKNVEAADAKFKEHRFKVTGVLRDRIIDLTPKNPPRGSYFMGIFKVKNSEMNNVGAIFRSKSRYSLKDAEIKKFTHIKKGDAVTLVCTGKDSGNKSMGVIPNLENCSFL